MRVLLITLLVCLVPVVADADSLLMIGNSLTADHRPMAVDALPEHDADWHISFSKSLDYIWNNPWDVSIDSATPWASVLPGTHYDHVVFQSYAASGSTLGGETQAITNFIDLIQSDPAGADTQFYLVEAWPWYSNATREGEWSEYWSSSFPDDPNELVLMKRAYYQRLESRVEDATGVDIQRVRSGEAFAYLSESYNLYKTFHSDPIHMGPVGEYVAWSSLMYTLFGEVDPEPPPGYFEGLTPQLRSDIAEAIWYVSFAYEADFNLDGHVDIDDFDVWQHNAGSSSGAWRTAGDTDEDGDVDIADLMTVQRQYMGYFGADFNGDTYVDAADLAAWLEHLGTASEATRMMGDTDADGDIDITDLMTLQRDYHGYFGTDFDGDADTDADDLAVWQANAGMASGASRVNGNTDADPDVDLADLMEWQRKYTGPYSADFDFDGDVDSEDLDVWRGERGCPVGGFHGNGGF